MPLADVLSAMREIILDDAGMVPEDYDERYQLFGERFPKLSSEEREDLAKIPHDRFSIYSGTIFNGEASVLGVHFPITIALVEKAWLEIEGEALDRFTFVRLLHQARPWVTQTTQGLGESLLNYLSEDRKDIRAAVPAVPDSARLELHSIDIKRCGDELLAPQSAEDLQQLLLVTVEELLQKDFAVTGCVVFEEFAYDVLALRRDFYKSGEKLSDSPVNEEHICAVGARPVALNSRWTAVSPGVYEYLTTIERREPYGLGELAEAVVSDVSDANEEVQFKKFLEVLSELVTIGAIVIDPEC